MKIDLPQAQTAILFAILFVVIGLAAPFLYVSIAPNSHFVEVHDFDAADTHVGAEEHNVCFERTVHKPSDADITIELVLLRDDGAIIEEDSFEVDAYYQEGREEVIITRELRTNSLEPGEYRYVHSVELNYYDGHVSKQFRFTSDSFMVHESEQALNQSGGTSC